VVGGLAAAGRGKQQPDGENYIIGDLGNTIMMKKIERELIRGTRSTHSVKPSAYNN
jgi:hypothetical protein